MVYQDPKLPILIIDWVVNHKAEVYGGDIIESRVRHQGESVRRLQLTRSLMDADILLAVVSRHLGGGR